MSLAHFWKIVMISSQPSEQYGFTTLFLFLLFLNSDIGIVILYILKYIRKAFSLPKKINFEVQNLTNIHVFRFAFSDLYCYHTDLQNARNAVSDNLIFIISRGGMPPDPPSKERLRRSLVRIINWSHPPVKKSWLRACKVSEVNLKQSGVFIRSKPKRGVTAYIIILRKGVYVGGIFRSFKFHSCYKIFISEQTSAKRMSSTFSKRIYTNNFW